MVRAVSVTRKRTVSASDSRTTLPASTSPPMRNARLCGASFAATWLGVKKNTRFDWKAFSTSVAATPSAARPAAIQSPRLVLGFKAALLIDVAARLRATHAQPGDLESDRDRGHAIGHPDVELVAHRERTHWVRRSRSRITVRTRTSEAPIAYAQNENVISIIPVNMETCIDVPLKETLEPWCSVFHQSTEK